MTPRMRRNLSLAVALLLLTACAVFSNRWAVPHAPPKMRPCVGTYVYPDSAGTCDEKGER